MRQVHIRQNRQTPQTRASDTEACGVWGWRVLYMHARRCCQGHAQERLHVSACACLPHSMLCTSRWQFVYYTAPCLHSVLGLR